VCKDCDEKDLDMGDVSMESATESDEVPEVILGSNASEIQRHMKILLWWLRKGRLAYRAGGEIPVLNLRPIIKKEEQKNLKTGNRIKPKPKAKPKMKVPVDISDDSDSSATDRKQQVQAISSDSDSDSVGSSDTLELTLTEKELLKRWIILARLAERRRQKRRTKAKAEQRRAELSPDEDEIPSRRGGRR